jgi:hypothetical protein
VPDRAEGVRKMKFANSFENGCGIEYGRWELGTTRKDDFTQLAVLRKRGSNSAEKAVRK